MLCIHRQRDIHPYNGMLLHAAGLRARFLRLLIADFSARSLTIRRTRGGICLMMVLGSHR